MKPTLLAVPGRRIGAVMSNAAAQDVHRTPVQDARP
jgi:hypothetical protein